MRRINRKFLVIAAIGFGLRGEPTAFCQQARTEASRKPNVGARARRLLLGGDISALAKIEDMGGVFCENGRPGDAIEIMSRHGCNCFRLRLFVNPTRRNVVVNDLPYTIALARRIKAANANLLLNFHYSDTWADPGHQTKPEAWKHLDFAALENTVREYSRDCIARLKREGVLPDLVQVGNEITPGMLWPDGKIYGEGDPAKQWEAFARLLKAGIRGVRDGAGPDGAVRIVLHIDKGGDWTSTKRFFDNIEKRQVPYDVIGLSFYPWWHGRMEDLQETLRRTATTFDKDVFVVETAYPYRPISLRGKYASDPVVYAMSPEGQKAFLTEVVRMVRETPNGRGLGVLWWYPESRPVAGLRIWHGGATALFDNDGNPLPALRSFARE